MKLPTKSFILFKRLLLKSLTIISKKYKLLYFMSLSNRSSVFSAHRTLNAVELQLGYGKQEVSVAQAPYALTPEAYTKVALIL